MLDFHASYSRKTCVFVYFLVKRGRKMMKVGEFGRIFVDEMMIWPDFC